MIIVVRPPIRRFVNLAIWGIAIMSEIRTAIVGPNKGQAHADAYSMSERSVPRDVVDLDEAKAAGGRRIMKSKGKIE